MWGANRGDVRAARLRIAVGDFYRTLIVVEGEELLGGQKRGIAAALRHAEDDLRTLARRAASGRLTRAVLDDRVHKALQREHLSAFVTVTVRDHSGRLSLARQVDPARRRHLERTRLGRPVKCTDQHTWSTGRIVYAFRGQWHVEELFRRAKKGGVVPWGPSHQRTDNALRLHAFATEIGLELVNLTRLALGARTSPRRMMQSLADVHATLVRVQTNARGRRPTVMLAPDLSADQRRAAKTFDFEGWLPGILSSMPDNTSEPTTTPLG